MLAQIQRSEFFKTELRNLVGTCVKTVLGYVGTLNRLNKENIFKKYQKQKQSSLFLSNKSKQKAIQNLFNPLDKLNFVETRKLSPQNHNRSYTKRKNQFFLVVNPLNLNVFYCTSTWLSTFPTHQTVGNTSRLLFFIVKWIINVWNYIFVSILRVGAERAGRAAARGVLSDFERGVKVGEFSRYLGKHVGSKKCVKFSFS